MPPSGVPSAACVTPETYAGHAVSASVSGVVDVTVSIEAPAPW